MKLQSLLIAVSGIASLPPSSALQTRPRLSITRTPFFPVGLCQLQYASLSRTTHSAIPFVLQRSVLFCPWSRLRCAISITASASPGSTFLTFFLAPLKVSRADTAVDVARRTQRVAGFRTNDIIVKHNGLEVSNPVPPHPTPCTLFALLPKK